jgi:hypothetical protein
MDQETRDILIGAAILIPFLIVVFAAGLVLNRFKNRKFAAAWRPLVPVIGGTVVDDGGGAATSWLTGRFEGRPVHASMTPNRNRTSEGGGLTYNYFDVALNDVPGRIGWQIRYAAGGVLPFGKASWYVEADDPAVAERLLRAGVLEMVRPLAEARAIPPTLATVRYDRGGATLTYCEDAGAQWIPSPERFREQLALLLRLASVNADINPR